MKKSGKPFFTKYGNTHDCSSQRRGLAYGRSRGFFLFNYSSRTLKVFKVILQSDCFYFCKSGTSLKGFVVCSRVFNGGKNSQNGGRFLFNPKGCQTLLEIKYTKGLGHENFLSVFLVSGEINFNFGRSVSLLSKSEVKISQFVSLKTREFISLRATRIEKIRKTFFHKIREYTRLQFSETRLSFTARSA